MTEIHAFDPDGTPSPGAQTALDNALGNIPEIALDPQIASLIGPMQTTSTTAALDRSYRRGWSVKEWGAVGDGITDDTVAIQAAADAVYGIDSDAVLHFPEGTYRTTGTLHLKCSVDGAAATVAYEGTGTAVIVGFDMDRDGRNASTNRRAFSLPRIALTPRPASGWDGTSAGVLARNLNSCTLTVPYVAFFERGLILEGEGTGFAYSTINLGALWENHQQLVLNAGAGGWVNQNLILGGRIQSVLNPSTGRNANDPDAIQVLVTAAAGQGAPNNNTFVNTSLEDNGVRAAFLDLVGYYNAFINCRWEAPNHTPRIRWRGNARNNQIIGGYNAFNIEESFEVGALGGWLRDSSGAYARARIATAQEIPSGISTLVTAWAPQGMRRVTYSGGTFTPRPGRWRVDATITVPMSDAGRRLAHLKVNTDGASTILATAEAAPSESAKTTLRVATTYHFDGQTSVGVNMQQTSGSSMALDTSSGTSTIELEYLG